MPEPQISHPHLISQSSNLTKTRLLIDNLVPQPRALPHQSRVWRQTLGPETQALALGMSWRIGFLSWQRLSSFAPTPLASLLQSLLQRAEFPKGQGLNILSLREGREEEEKLKVPWEEWGVDSRNNLLPVQCHRME